MIPTSSASRVPDLVRRLLGMVCLALAAFYLLFVFFLVHLATDQSWYLYAAEQVRTGTVLYGPHLTETNPPLIIWMSLVPAILGHLLHISSLAVFKLCVLAVLTGSALWTHRFLKLSDVPLQTPDRKLLVLLLFCCELLIQPSLFGQREQLIVALLVPYMLTVLPGVRGRLSTLEQVLLGFTAGIAICLKPFHACTIICFELFVAFYTRSLRRVVRPATLSLVATGVVYVASIRLFSPLYLSQTLPALGATYWAFGRFTFPQMLLHQNGLVPPLILLLAVFYAATFRRLGSPLIVGALLAASIGASLSYDIQHTAWGYQQFPELCFVLFAAVWMLLDLLLLRRPTQLLTLRPPVLQWALPLLAALAAFALLAHRREKATQGSAAPTMASTLAGLPEGTPVYVFSTNMQSLPVILEHHLTWSSRFGHLWLLPALIDNEQGVADPSRRSKQIPATEVSTLDATLHHDTAEDLAYWQPRYVLVERCPEPYACAAIDRPFDTLAWFSRSPEFRNEWSKYRKAAPVEGYDVYTRTAAALTP